MGTLLLLLQQQIDYEGALNGKNLEIVWVDPIEFFLHIQGRDASSTKAIVYGHYHARMEGDRKFLKDDIPKDKMSLQSIEERSS